MPQENRMLKGYWIARYEVTDPEQYKAYIAANAKPFKDFGARFLVRSGRYAPSSLRPAANRKIDRTEITERMLH